MEILMAIILYIIYLFLCVFGGAFIGAYAVDKDYDIWWVLGTTLGYSIFLSLPFGALFYLLLT